MAGVDPPAPRTTPSAGHRLGAVACFVLAVAAVVGSVNLIGSGFVGPAPVLLAGAGGLLSLGFSLWRGPRSEGRNRAYPGA
jgi:hypothetical protein